MLKSFVFDGNWSPQIDLPKLATLKQEVAFWSKGREKKRLDNLILFVIQDDLSDNPDPNKAQINAINILLNNEDAILYSIFEEIKKQYPALEQHQREFYEIDETHMKDDFPELVTPADLENVLKINTIQVSLVEKDNYAFLIIDFNSSWDIEHGCTLIIHQDKVVQFNNGYEWNLEILDGDTESYENCMRANNVHIYAKGMYFYPHPKYNKLKPTQEYANTLFNLEKWRKLQP